MLANGRWDLIRRLKVNKLKRDRCFLMMSGVCVKRQTFTGFWLAVVLTKVEGNERPSAWSVFLCDVAFSCLMDRCHGFGGTCRLHLYSSSCSLKTQVRPKYWCLSYNYRRCLPEDRQLHIVGRESRGITSLLLLQQLLLFGHFPGRQGSRICRHAARKWRMFRRMNLRVQITIRFVYGRASNRQLLQYVAGSCILRSK